MSNFFLSKASSTKRSFLKQVYRYSHTRPYRHNENLWPYVKIERGDGGEITALYYKHRPVKIVPLSKLHNSCQGEALLTATGPSVKTLRFENIPVMPAIGVNGAYFLNQQVNFRFYVIVDMGFIDSRPEIVRNVIQRTELTLFTTVHGIVRILDRFGQEAIRCRLTVVEDASCKIYHPRLESGELHDYYHRENGVVFSKENRTLAFSQDIRCGIFDAGTVAYWAMQIIAYLGFKQLFIAGLDMNNFHQPRFYETEQDRLPTFLADKVESLVIPAFRHAGAVMKKQQIAIKNLSLHSAIESDIFEKVDGNVYFQ